MTINNVLKNLKKLVGERFDYNEVICSFEDFEENGKSEVYVGESHNNGYNYIAYINAVESTEFLFTVNNGIIKDVWVA